MQFPVTFSQLQWPFLSVTCGLLPHSRKRLLGAAYVELKCARTSYNIQLLWFEFDDLLLLRKNRLMHRIDFWLVCTSKALLSAAYIKSLRGARTADTDTPVCISSDL